MPSQKLKARTNTADKHGLQQPERTDVVRQGMDVSQVSPARIVGIGINRSQRHVEPTLGRLGDGRGEFRGLK